MSYIRPISDAPAPLSMMPRATTITLDDLLYLVQTGNPIGQRSKSLTLSVLAQFLWCGGTYGWFKFKNTV